MTIYIKNNDINFLHVFFKHTANCLYKHCKTIVIVVLRKVTTLY